MEAESTAAKNEIKYEFTDERTTEGEIDSEGAQEEGKGEKRLEVEITAKALPSINEELAKIFPDSAEKFLNQKSGKKRGRPKKMLQKLKVPGRGRGRPRKNPVMIGPGQVAPLRIVQKKQGKVGRARNPYSDIPLPDATAVVEWEIDRTRIAGQVGHHKKIGYSDTCVPIEAEKLRRKPRMSYVDDYVDEDDSVDQFDTDCSYGLSHSEDESDQESESGFESDSQDVVPRKRGRPKKDTTVPGKKAGLSRYLRLKLQLLQLKSNKGKRIKKLKIAGPKRSRGRPRKDEFQLQLLQFKSNKGKRIKKLKIAGPKRSRGRPRKDEIQRRILMVRLERLHDPGVRLERLHDPGVTLERLHDPGVRLERLHDRCVHSGTEPSMHKKTCLKKKISQPPVPHLTGVKKKRGRPSLLSQVRDIKEKICGPALVTNSGGFIMKKDQPNPLPVFDGLKRKRGRPKKSTGIAPSYSQGDRSYSNVRTNAGPSYSQGDQSYSNVRTNAGPSYSQGDRSYSNVRTNAGPSYSQADRSYSNVRTNAGPSHSQGDRSYSNVRTNAGPSHSHGDRSYSNVRTNAGPHSNKTLGSIKRKRGRPKKSISEAKDTGDIEVKEKAESMQDTLSAPDTQSVPDTQSLDDTQNYYLKQEKPSKKRGRPKLDEVCTFDMMHTLKKKRGRPPKHNKMQRHDQMHKYSEEHQYDNNPEPGELLEVNEGIVPPVLSSSSHEDGVLHVLPAHQQPKKKRGRPCKHSKAQRHGQVPEYRSDDQDGEKHASDMAPDFDTLPVLPMKLASPQGRGRPMASRGRGRTKGSRGRGRPKSSASGAAISTEVKTGAVDQHMHDGLTAMDKSQTSEAVNDGSEFPKDATRSDYSDLLETPVLRQFKSENNYTELPVSIASDLDYVVELNSSDSNSSKDMCKSSDRDSMEGVSINQCTSENLPVKQTSSDPLPFMNAATSNESDFPVNGFSKQSDSNLSHSNHPAEESQSTDLNTGTEPDSKKIVLEHQSVVKMSGSNSDLDVEDSLPVSDSLTELKACFDPEFCLNGNGIQSCKKMNSSVSESLMEPTASTDTEFVIDKYLL